jgi:type VI secretion system VasI family protein
MNLFDEDSVIMANVRALATAALLMTFASGASIAMPLQDIPAEVKSCKAISDDKERLKCFDGVFAEPSKPQKPPEERQAQKPPEEKHANWSTDETQSPDGNPEVVAANLVNDTVLILRCKNQTTEAAFSTQYNYLGYKSVDVELRINDQSPIKEVWKASMNGRAAFAPDAVAFIQSLPDNGKLSIRTTRSTDGKMKEGNFNLGAVSEVRDKISKACDWANGSVDEPVGSIDRQEKR